MKPIVAIIGRPNVGKSSFFNRLTKTKDALVDNFPGVTRDRKYGNVIWNDIPFTLIDTGGFAEENEHEFAAQIRFQVHQAMENADAIVMMLDGKTGVSPFDKDIIAMLRAINKPVFYTVNKIDTFAQEKHFYEFHSLGIETLYPVSAEHGYGVSDFLDDLVRSFPKPDSDTAEEKEDEIIQVAVVGRPNVGKSSLINRILGEERLVVSDIPGTTRDSVDSLCIMNGKPYLLIDTAGIRRKGKVSEKIEKFSIIKALKSIERCDVAIILIDAHEGITEQDITIAGYAYERGCGCIFLMNKWDLIEKKDTKAIRQYNEKLREAAKFLSFAPALTISALTGLRVSKVFNLIKEVYKQYSTRIGTGRLNKIMETAIEKNEPPFHKGKRLKFYYATQVAIKPPSFVCFVNFPDAVHFSYERYLVNQIRETGGLDKTPLRIFFRQRTGRIDFDKKKKSDEEREAKHQIPRSQAKQGKEGKENKLQRAKRSRKERKR